MHQRFEAIVALVLTFLTSIIQTRVVLLIALLALARKFIILNPEMVNASQLVGPGVVTIAPGATYRLIREREQADYGDSRN